MSYDVNGIIAQFLGTERNPEQRELVLRIGAAMRDRGQAVNGLVAQVAHECLNQPRCTPEVTVRIAIMYGMVLGIEMEKDRVSREHKLS